MLAARLPADGVLLIDLAYADFMASPPALSADILNRHPNTVVCGSLYTAACLLGARVGYGLAATRLADRLRAPRLPYAMDSLALAAARAALDDDQAARRRWPPSRCSPRADGRRPDLRIVDLIRSLAWATSTHGAWSYVPVTAGLTGDVAGEPVQHRPELRMCGQHAIDGLRRV